MSEPVSNAEVEDVLASIRRLVSEEKRPASKGPEAAIDTMSDAPLPAQTGKLMLTASLRVAAPNHSAEDVADAAFSDEAVKDEHSVMSFDANVVEDTPAEHAQAEQHEAPLLLTDLQTDDSAEVEVPSSAIVVAPESELAEIPERALPDVTPEEQDTPTEDRSEQAVVEETIGVNAEVHQPSADTTAQATDSVPEMAASLSAKIAALEAVIGKRVDQWEPDGVAEDPYSGTEDPTIAWEDHAPGAEFTDAVDSAEVSPEEIELVEADEDEDDMQSEGPDTVVEDTAPAVELPDADLNLDTETESLTEPYAKSSIDAIADEAEDDFAAAILASEDDVLDEDALRDMVADIVRQELQGALGERITRNVRKLVRREIHRALATQDLE